MAFPSALTQAQDRNVITGICNVNGTAVTRVSGDSFTSIICGYIEIGGNADEAGVLYAINNIIDADHLILNSSGGVQTNAYFTAALEIKALHLNALEAKVGVDASTVVTSLDYRVSTLEGANICPWRVGDLLETTREISAGNPENPNVAWPATTWALWGSGRMPVGFNAGDADFNAVEKIGGGKTKNLAHIHSQPVHTHGITANSDVTGLGAGTTLKSPPGPTDSGGDDSTGSALSATQDVMNPYIVRYCWKRTA